jgi:hypothetical protein
MRALAIAAVLLFVVTPAYAQKKSDEQKKADAARQAKEDEAYKASLRRIQAKDAASGDPWGAVRNDPPQGKSKAPANTAR